MALALLEAKSPESHPSGRFPALRVLVLAAAALLIAQAGVTAGIAPALTLCLAGLGLLYLAARLDRRAHDKLLPAQSLNLRHPIGAGLLAMFALAVATTGFWAYGPLLLKVMFGIEPLISGYILAGEALAWSAATMVVAAATVSAGRMLIRVGTALVAAGAAGLALVVPAGSLAGIVVCVLLPGVGFGLCWPAIVQRTVRFAAEPERALAAAAPAPCNASATRSGPPPPGSPPTSPASPTACRWRRRGRRAFGSSPRSSRCSSVGMGAAWRFTAAKEP